MAPATGLDPAPSSVTGSKISRFTRILAHACHRLATSIRSKPGKNATLSLGLGWHAEHLSVYQTSPKLWEREAFEEKLDGAPEATGEPGKFSAGELGRLTVRVFFSAGAGLLAWSHMPVETAQ